MLQNFVSAALLDVLVCPVCHQKLERTGEDDAQSPAPIAGKAAGAIAAWLHCLGCGRRYPIEDGLAVMLAERATYKAAKDIG